ncbi:hypothetical protein DFH06DRAFT_1243724 [Mycena polygramma]|nr:hypothetical protein DFH06DRAFT_1243724 [Mycena polygramma]
MFLACLMFCTHGHLSVLTATLCESSLIAWPSVLNKLVTCSLHAAPVLYNTHHSPLLPEAFRDAPLQGARIHRACRGNRLSDQIFE